VLTLKEDSLESQTEVEKSKFFSYAFKVFSADEARNKVKRIRDDNPKASHVCYSYILSEGQSGASEDKEPISSFHRLLALMHHKGIGDVCVVIVRYFGGTLLGASNLDRLYFRLGSDLINDDNVRPLMDFIYFRGKIRTSLFTSFKKEIQAGGGIISSFFNGPDVDVDFFVHNTEGSFFSYFMTYEEYKREEK